MCDKRVLKLWKVRARAERREREREREHGHTEGSPRRAGHGVAVNDEAAEKGSVSEAR